MSVTVFGEVYDDRFAPAEEEVAGSGAQDDGGAEPRVVGHEHQHQHVAHENLQPVQRRLPRVRPAQHPRPAYEKPLMDLKVIHNTAGHATDRA